VAAAAGRQARVQDVLKVLTSRTAADCRTSLEDVLKVLTSRTAADCRTSLDGQADGTSSIERPRRVKRDLTQVSGAPPLCRGRLRYLPTQEWLPGREVMDGKRYQVFVSSTYLDLVEERQAVTSALLQLDAFPSGMELFPAADDDAWTLIRRVIDECDYYLLVVGGKYGSTDPVSHISFTEKEYDYATSRGKPVMAFIHGDPDSIPVGKAERDPEAQKKLDDFRDKVKTAKHVKFWTGADQLAGQVALSFAQFTRQYPAVGWVRANQLTNSDALEEINALRKTIVGLESQLNSIRTAPPPGTEHLSQGSDKFRLSARFRFKYQDDVGYTEHDSVWKEVQVTWDELFAGIAPRLLDECEQESLHRYLDDWFASKWWDFGGDDLIKKYAEEQELDVRSGLSGVAINTHDDDFGTILVQLMALGLIRKGVKKRSVTNSRTFWALTPFGETRTIQLRAIARSSARDNQE
jgi:hypothetical protein